ncbi:MAG: sigma 54-interacting transcriptional regulator, partial [Firmicutes bacterium]|nr:sigma 54-interacting transcriptional regulator [Bacillota bacterium]
ASGRKGPFVAINCSAIPEHLFESEMFGYVAGAFTGALRKGKMGKFEMADRGTLFLDEIGDMPAQMQAKLLRVLQEQKIYRVGSEKAIDIDVRVISASNKDLENMVKEGQFREDLYYRLNVVKIELPPLRERKEDIPLLVECFVQEFCQKNKLTPPRITPDIIALLMNYEWKGNVRELRNTVEHLVIFSQAGKIDINSIPDYIREQLQKRNKRMEELFELKACVAKAEQQTIARVMQMVKGNKSRAAKILNIPRSTLYYKLNYYNMKEYL